MIGSYAHVQYVCSSRHLHRYVNVTLVLSKVLFSDAVYPVFCLVTNKMSTQSGSGVNSSVASNQKVKNASKKLIQRVDSEVREAFTLFDKVINNDQIFYYNS